MMAERAGSCCAGWHDPPGHESLRSRLQIARLSEAEFTFNQAETFRNQAFRCHGKDKGSLDAVGQICKATEQLEIASFLPVSMT